MKLEIDLKRLSIVVPYRDRAEQLQAFVPHMGAYFSRDLVAREIPVRILIVEQSEHHPFNSGMCKNAGFQLLADDTDYVAFHDVDYLPIWADYTPPTGLAGIVWYGAESRPIVPGRPERAVHNLDNFYGGAVLATRQDFSAVNGYPNSFWGWASDDVDLLNRFRAQGLPASRRRGTFSALDHVHGGYRVDGSKNEAASRNETEFNKRWAGQSWAAIDRKRAMIDDDGLRSLRFDVVRRELVTAVETAERAIAIEKVTVRLERTGS